MTRCGLARVLAIGLICACGPERPPARPAPTATAPAESAPRFELAGVPAEADPIELRRTADREGALGLMARVRQGDATALAALPHAEDAELVLGELCALAMRAKGATLGAVLGAVHGVATRLPPDRERLAPETFARCMQRLWAIEADGSVSPHERDLAASARQALAEQLAPEGPP